MKKLVWTALFFLLPLFVHAEWFTQSEEVNVNFVINGEANIKEESSNAKISHVTVNLSLVPESSFQQEVVTREISPQAQVKDGVAFFTFNNPQDRIEYTVNAVIRTTNTFLPIGEKISFPHLGFSEEFEEYLAPTEIINSDDETIVKVASEIVEGEDDYYGAVFKLAAWTRENIDYNLSSLTAEVSQPASWVLENRKGVCDELTSLFISMLRSIGIPAKFITGYAFTNSPLFPENWGAHGWAEVYFPGVGWVPFDVTYGEYGFVDPTHIKLKEAVDADAASTRYEWLGRDVSLDISELDMDVTLLGYSGIIPPLFKIEARPLKEEIQFGSYNAVEVVIENLRNFYVATELLLAAPDEVEFITSQKKDVLFKPKEKKSVFWMFRLGGNLNKDYVYTFPFTIRTSRNTTSTSMFTSTAFSPHFSLTDIGQILDQKVEEEQKTYSSNVEMNCTGPGEEFYDYEAQKVRCGLQNIGNVFLEDLEVCYGEECQTVDVGIGREFFIEFPITTFVKGKREERITASNNQISKAAIAPIEVLDEPSIAIEDVEKPLAVDFEEEFTVSFLLNKESYSSPQEVEIRVEPIPFGRSWSFKELAQSQHFEITLRGSDLSEGAHDYMVIVQFQDGNGKEHKVEKEVQLILNKLTIPQKVQGWVKKGADAFGTGEGSLLLIYALIGFGVFAFLILIIFPPNKKVKKNRKKEDPFYLLKSDKKE